MDVARYYGVAKRKRHPCTRWCEGRLHGIVDNLKLRGEIEPDSKFEFIALRGLMHVPGGTYILKCEHGREWMVKDVTDAKT
jgi:hypothetical protein